MSELLLERRDGVVTLTLNRPDRLNALTGPQWDDLRAIFEEVASNRGDRVLVITGAGKGFCAGADLATGGSPAGDGDPLERMRVLGRSAAALHDIGKPTIAKVNGVAAGAGLSLALGCDLVIASEAARFSAIFVKRALSFDYGGSWLLPRLIGMHRAKELGFLGDVIDAAEAERIGLVNRVVPAAELDSTVDALAARLLAMPPIALAHTKELLDRATTRTYDEALEAEAVAQVANLATADVREAMSAFVEKREPRFTGE